MPKESGKEGEKKKNHAPSNQKVSFHRHGDLMPSVGDRPTEKVESGEREFIPCYKKLKIKKIYSE